MHSAGQETDCLSWAHPLVRSWFFAKFGTASEVQEAAWKEISQGNSTLISAPTGSGKTLAAFLYCIDTLVRKACAGTLEDRTELVYVSPLKALSNDIQKNLDLPLLQISQLAKSEGIKMQEIRTAVRSGDTLASERARLLKKAPHILVTTPESLYILITAAKSRENLRQVRTLIVDEIHALADDKRGAHLALSLERLELLCPVPLQRIGLSATQKPIELVARFLVGSKRPLPEIVNCGHSRPLDLAVVVPGLPLAAVASNEQWQETYDQLAELVKAHRSTLIFVNTRRMAEKLTLNLAERLGEDAVAAHHGSLARKLRHQVESRLKAGELRAIVATASLELGIDVGTIDLVCLISSPRSIAVGLQRIGRAGHFAGAVPKGRIFPSTRDDLLESAALTKAIRSGDLDRLCIPQMPLDILAQQIVATCSSQEMSEDALYEMSCRAYPYAELSKEDFYKVIEMLAEGISATRGRYGAYIHWNRVDKLLKGRKGARLAAITSGGAIPETALYNVVALPEETQIGTIDEDFAVESMAGDIFLLGNSSWSIRRVESSRSRVLVEDAHGAAPTIPFWLGEAAGRSQELSLHLAELRKFIAQGLAEINSAAEPERKQDELLSRLTNEYGLCSSGAQQALEYVAEAMAVLKAVPTQDQIIAERFFNEGGGMELIIHSPFGARLNKAWGLALRKCFCRSFNFELQAAATDNGLNISLGEQHSFPLADVFAFLSPESVQNVLEQAALASPIFNTRFRWDANRSLALLRFQGGKKVPPYLQRLKSDDLLAAVFPQAAACQDNIDGDIEIPEHPLITEVMKDVLTEAMDIEGLKELLERIRSGKIKCLAVDTPVPSAFCHEILNANPYAYLDDAPLEERRARAVELRRVLPDNLQDLAALDPQAIEQVLDELKADLKDADELSDLLQSLIVLPETLIDKIAPGQRPAFDQLFKQLELSKRAAKAEIESAVILYLSAEKKEHFSKIYPGAVFHSELAELELSGQEKPTQEKSIQLLLQGWLEHLGPVKASSLSKEFAINKSDLDLAFLHLEASGQVLRGKFIIESAGTDGTEIQWCQRRILARIHRLSISKLRKSIEPQTPLEFMNWLFDWQHLAAGTQLPADERGLLEVINQLQGFEIPASAWESKILKARLKDYDPSILDRLCLTGRIGWGRISPHPATMQVEDDKSKWRIIPTSSAPIAFFLREQSEFLPAIHPDSFLSESKTLSAQAVEVKEFLQARGASFFADIKRAVKLLPSEIENALWELVAAGLVTADGFDNLRALLDPKRRSGQGREKYRMPRHTSGRWSLLYINDPERSKQLEAAAWVFLRRYGVVFRDLLSKESIAPKWRELLTVFRRLEDRGEIRGGRFVSSFSGEQFALPEALESLRAFRRRPHLDKPPLRFSAADPLNLVGIVIPGKRIPAVSSKLITFKDGKFFEEAENINPLLLEA